MAAKHGVARRPGNAASVPTSSASSDVGAVLDAMGRIVEALRASSRTAERRLGISGAQLFVLRQLADAPAASLNELAARTFTHQSSVSVVVSRLVARRLVSRTTSPADARRWTISLTAAGRALLRKAPAQAHAQLVAALERLPPSERRALALGLERLLRETGFASETPAMLLEEEQLQPRIRGADRRRD
jgi:DNA-binding MarR family transcriptional regulator